MLHFSSFAATGSAHSPEADKIQQLLERIEKKLLGPGKSITKGIKKGLAATGKELKAVEGWLGKKGKEAWQKTKKLFG